MIEQWHRETCKFCNGTGIQVNKDGIRIKCPECGGTGQRNVSNCDNLPPGLIL
jgi:DnaJ-class molecular chaperone